ncbi:hypothetical protein [Aminivibrio sp.]|nr:hypothetical protein [Aminivibrio sp.]
MNTPWSPVPTIRVKEEEKREIWIRDIEQAKNDTFSKEVTLKKD